MLYIGLKSMDIVKTSFKEYSVFDIKPSSNSFIYDTFFVVYDNCSIFAALNKTHRHNVEEISNHGLTNETAFTTSSNINFTIKELNPKKATTQDYQLLLLELVINSYRNTKGRFDVLDDILDGHKYTLIKDYYHETSHGPLDESIDDRIDPEEFEPDVSQYLIKLYHDPSDKGYLPPTTITTVGGEPLPLEQQEINRADFSLRILNRTPR